jgi:alkanesulfonate monooxygenase SsuD/methylene tetrahydromethanopterin reductase-like flavin-dependent oxidoreductase (luciferase family)
VELSAFSVVDAFPPELAAGRDRYAELLSLATECDAAGLHAFWVAEHHFHAGGLCPSPPVVLAAVGQRTHRIRVGVLVSVLPFHEPVALAEEYALLDHVVGGRLNLGLGSGYIPMEFEGFGVDPAARRERFDRGFETVLAAFRGEEVRVGAPGATPVRINVRPVQLPRPPIWMAVQRREAIPFVARRGVSVALVPYATLAGFEELREEVREFRRNLPEGARARVSVALHLHAGQDVAGARSALQRYLDSRRATQSRFYEQKVEADPSQASAAAIERSGFALFGPAADVAEKLGAFREAGVDEVLGIFDFGGLRLEEVLGSVRALGAAFRP